MSSTHTASSQHPKDEALLNYVQEFLTMKKQISRMQEFLIKTECEKSQFCEETGLELYLKKDFRQITGSCHARSALCTLLNLSFEQKQNGVVTALEEDALPLCYFGKKLKIPVTIVLPKTTSLSKIHALEQYQHTSITLLIQGNNSDEAERNASDLATMNNMYCIKRNDRARFIGYGTIGIEIVEQVPNLDVIVVPNVELIYTSILLVMAVLKPSVKVIIAADKSINLTLKSTSEIVQSIQLSPSTLPTPDSTSNQVISTTSSMSVMYTSSSSNVQILTSLPTLFSATKPTLPSVSAKILSSSTKPTSSPASVEILSPSIGPTLSSASIGILSRSTGPTPSSASIEILSHSTKPTLSSASIGILSCSTGPTPSSASIEILSHSTGTPFSASTDILPSTTKPTSSSASDQKLLPSTKLIPSVEISSSSIKKTSCEPAQTLSILKDSILSQTSLNLPQSQKGEPLVNKDVDVTTVVLTDKEIDTSILKLFKKERCIVNKFGAMSLAACLRAHDPSFEAYKNKRVVSLLTSCNDDIVALFRILKRALFKESRLMKVSAKVPQDELHPTIESFNALTNNVSMYKLTVCYIIAICSIITICLLILYVSKNS